MVRRPPPAAGRPRFDPTEEVEPERVIDTGSLRTYAEQQYGKIVGGQGPVVRSSLHNCPYQDNSLDLFLVLAYQTLVAPIPLAATLEASPADMMALHQTIADRFVAWSGRRVMPLGVVSRMGRAIPFPVMTLEASLDAMQRQEPGEWAALTEGMTTPDTVLARHHHAGWRFLLICGVDLPGTFTNKDRTYARRLLQDAYRAKCPVLAICHDEESIEATRQAGIFKDMTVPHLGRFA